MTQLRQARLALPDNDEALENQEWLDAIDNLIDYQGSERARDMLHLLQTRLVGRGLLAATPHFNTPYRNTIEPADQPAYPGDLALEQRIEHYIRWNALAMVVQANRNGSGVGGHIATYQSTATALEVGFNHFFRAPSADYAGDHLFIQAHASPGVYARAFLEGRLSAAQLANFRRELQAEGGLCSYPHPRRMPDFWQSPSASMGLSTPSAIYQARFMKYLEQRGLKQRSGGRVWCFIGDGEADEPEVLGSINVAGREGLDNLVMVVNCNLQRLDGPVRGNGKVIQELERSYAAAGWNVLKVLWSRDWDELLAQDQAGVLPMRMEQACDGDYQYYSTLPAAEQLAQWIQNDPSLAQLLQSVSAEEFASFRRGGHDQVKLFAAYQRAVQQTNGRPTVILIKTLKGDGLGEQTVGQNNAHQKKVFTGEDCIALGRQWGIPLSDDALAAAQFYQPSADSAEAQYLQQQRQALNGYLPQRATAYPPLSAVQASHFRKMRVAKERPQSTTMAFMRLLASLLRDPAVGQHIVPIVPDEARTFGMESLFKPYGIYAPQGQHYQPVDGHTLLAYREAADGQVLQEGINETGAMASFLAAGTAYAHHGVACIPFYTFYSIFGFQRVADMIWACADSLAQGFLMGGTAGRTTLNGEGLQHQDGHTHLMAATVPNLYSYDPAFAFELAVIVQDGLCRMYEQGEKILYYITLYNQNHAMPAMPEGVEQGILQGLYRFQQNSQQAQQPKVHLFGSGSIMQEVLQAADLLAAQGCSCDIWSVTSYNQLLRDAQAVERTQRLQPDAEPAAMNYIERCLAAEQGVFVLASDYMKALPDSIIRYLPGRSVSLGTDGFGLSEARPELRAHFEVDAAHIAWAALSALYRDGEITPAQLQQAQAAWGVQTAKDDPLHY